MNLSGQIIGGGVVSTRERERTRKREWERGEGGMKSEIVYSPETTVLYMFNKTLIDLQQ